MKPFQLAIKCSWTLQHNVTARVSVSRDKSCRPLNVICKLYRQTATVCTATRIPREKRLTTIAYHPSTATHTAINAARQWADTLTSPSLSTQSSNCTPGPVSLARAGITGSAAHAGRRRLGRQQGWPPWRLASRVCGCTMMCVGYVCAWDDSDQPQHTHPHTRACVHPHTHSPRGRRGLAIVCTRATGASHKQ